MARNVWSTSSLLVLSDHPPRTKAGASSTLSKCFARPWPPEKSSRIERILRDTDWLGNLRYFGRDPTAPFCFCVLPCLFVADLPLAFTCSPYPCCVMHGSVTM